MGTGIFLAENDSLPLIDSGPSVFVAAVAHCGNLRRRRCGYCACSRMSGRSCPSFERRCRNGNCQGGTRRTTPGRKRNATGDSRGSSDPRERRLACGRRCCQAVGGRRERDTARKAYGADRQIPSRPSHLARWTFQGECRTKSAPVRDEQRAARVRKPRRASGSCDTPGMEWPAGCAWMDSSATRDRQH